MLYDNGTSDNDSTTTTMIIITSEAQSKVAQDVSASVETSFETKYNIHQYVSRTLE